MSRSRTARARRSPRRATTDRRASSGEHEYPFKLFFKTALIAVGGWTLITGAVVSGATELRVDDIPLSTTKQSGSRAEAQETTAVCAHLRRCHKGARRLARAPVRRTPPTSRAGGSPALCRARQRFFGNLHPKMIKNTPGDCRLLPNYYFDCRLQSDSQINVHPPL